jgi:hypothetical protein
VDSGCVRGIVASVEQRSDMRYYNLNANPLRSSAMQTAKDQVKQLLEQLPDNASLNDIRYELNDSLYALYVRQQIELGMQASREGRVTSHDDVKKRLLNRAR